MQPEELAAIRRRNERRKALRDKERAAKNAAGWNLRDLADTPESDIDLLLEEIARLEAMLEGHD